MAQFPNSTELIKLSCFRDRFSSQEIYSNWASGRWRQLESTGPFQPMPVDVTYDEGVWGTFQRDFYAAVYSSDAFTDIADFALFIRYSSSIQQDLIKSGKTDNAFFFSEEEEDGIRMSSEIWSTLEIFLGNQRICDVLASWSLPDTFSWLEQLRYIEGAFAESPVDGELMALTSEGYLSFFVLDG